MPENSGGKRVHSRPAVTQRIARTVISRRNGRRHESTRSKTVEKNLERKPFLPSVPIPIRSEPFTSTAGQANFTSLTFSSRPSSPTSFGFPSSDFGDFNFGDETDEDGRGIVEETSGDIVSIQCEANRSKRVRISPYEQWLPHRQCFLNRLFIHDSITQTGSSIKCSDCPTQLQPSSRDTVHRCLDCFHSPIFCRPCLLKSHKNHPFHRVESWNSEYWSRRFLSDYDDYLIHFGHSGEPCPYPSRRDMLMILHVNGFHQVRVRFCGCSTVAENRLEVNQLLDAQLFPASLVHPRSAFTFASLDSLCVMSMRGKISAYDYYHSLCALTDICDLQGFPTRYDELTFTIRRYRDVLRLKRGGIGHHPSGISGMNRRDLTVESPASPLPGKNLPSNWQVLYDKKPHLRALFLALDANFRLKLKDRGKSKHQAPLTGGAGYFVNPELFHKELARFEGEKPIPEKSTCDSTFAAIERANSRLSRGFSVTGVVAAIDSRHGFVLPGGVANLQKGERYFNTDFAFLSALQDQGLDAAFVSYDIACQWMKNLPSRSAKFPAFMTSHLTRLALTFAIPKFHLPAHGFTCLTKFSLNFIPGSCRVDGEAIERLWASTNPVAMSTQEMSAGAREEFLEDRWNYMNFRKLVELGSSLSKKLSVAVAGSKAHSTELAELSASQDPQLIKSWTQMIIAYHEAPDRNPDPYRVSSQEYTMSDLVKELRAEDQVPQDNLDDPIPSETNFIISGVEIQHEQIKFCMELKEKKKKGGQLSVTDSRYFDKRRAALGRRISGWISQQAIFMPAAIALRTSSSKTSAIHIDDPLDLVEEDREEGEPVEHEEESFTFGQSTNPEEVELLLPSSPICISSKLSSPSLQEKERRFRVGRLDTHLSELRRLLRVKASVNLEKKAHSRGQKAGTRSNTILTDYATKISLMAEYYRGERLAALRLDPHGAWQHRLKELRKEDVRPINANAEDVLSEPNTVVTAKNRVWQEGQRSISWIWKVPRIDVQDSDISDQEAIATEEGKVDQAVQVEWAKTYARVNRYKEEQELVLEEMKRVQRYFVWRRAWWADRESSGPRDVHPMTISGRLSYARKQSGILRQLSEKFVKMWSIRLSELGLPLDSIKI